MCYREVRCARHACGHEHPQSDKKIDCGSPACRYSQAHSPACSPKTCPQTCKQWLKPARNVVVSNSPARCGHCCSK
ncbi:hypothetical protein HYPSUDRAFT_190707 [Hypholoma sublateritium FD-334 SS-4]|uniref:Uncharacterized protein n=1 Tax=Hypholoma sublateritium (strain FD-334 SS-4) TaxID=945553 RepID=A0A0D2M6E8_HYPSF|nr:hypothetical protein HYPSUDRAFT_190707 [Hypholoma sublateritium FD-334 SS-4]